MIRAPVASASCMTSSPPTTSDSLLASARSMPSPSVATVGPEAGGADERVEDEVGAGLETSRTSPSGAGEHLAVGPRLGGAGARVGVGERDPRRRRARGLRDERLPRALGAQADELEIGRARDDVERLGADRAGRSEDEQAASHGSQCGIRVVTRRK